MDGSLEQFPGGPAFGFTFGDLRLESDGTLLRGDVPLHITPKELAALRLLLENSGRIVTPQQMKQALWSDVSVTPDSIPRCISSLRARLGSSVPIRTIYKRGYRLDGPVRRHLSARGSNFPRLAILPFEGRNGTPEHLAPSLAEDLSARLTSLRPPFLHVLARDSTFTLASHGLTAIEVGQRLGADYVLSGILQGFAEALRLRVEMIGIPEGHQVWVEDILVLRSHAANLGAQLLERIAYRFGVHRPPAAISAEGREESAVEPAAFDHFLLGRHEAQSLERNRVQHGIELLTRASDLDKSLDAAREELARTFIKASLFGYESPAKVAAEVRRSGGGALDAEEMSHTLLPSLGWIAFHVDHDLALALRTFSLADQPQPDSWFAWLRTLLELSRHHFDDAIRLLESALQIDPFAPCLNAELAWVHHLAGHSQESLAQAERNLARLPGNEIVELCAATIFAYQGDALRAAEMAQRVAVRRPQFDIASAIEAYALARLGKTESAIGILERLQWASHERYLCTSFTPAAYLALNDVDSALADLKAAEKAGCPWFFQTLADPRLASLHGTPEFERMRSLLQTMEESVAAESEYVI